MLLRKEFAMDEFHVQSGETIDTCDECHVEFSTEAIYYTKEEAFEHYARIIPVNHYARIIHHKVCAFRIGEN